MAATSSSAPSPSPHPPRTLTLSPSLRVPLRLAEPSLATPSCAPCCVVLPFGAPLFACALGHALHASSRPPPGSTRCKETSLQPLASAASPPPHPLPFPRAMSRPPPARACALRAKPSIPACSRPMCTPLTRCPPRPQLCCANRGCGMQWCGVPWMSRPRVDLSPPPSPPFDKRDAKVEHPAARMRPYMCGTTTSGTATGLGLVPDTRVWDAVLAAPCG